MRPTKLTDELLDKAQEYVENYLKYGDVVPTVAGMACELGVRRETLHEWARTDYDERFSNIFNRLSALQERRLINGGLSNDFNPAVTKMMLTKHGHSDKVEQDHTSSDGSMTPRDTSLAVLDALKRKHESE